MASRCLHTSITCQDAKKGRRSGVDIPPRTGQWRDVLAALKKVVADDIDWSRHTTKVRAVKSATRKMPHFCISNTVVPADKLEPLDGYCCMPNGCVVSVANVNYIKFGPQGAADGRRVRADDNHVIWYAIVRKIYSVEVDGYAPVAVLRVTWLQKTASKRRSLFGVHQTNMHHFQFRERAIEQRTFRGKTVWQELQDNYILACHVMTTHRAVHIKSKEVDGERFDGYGIVDLTCQRELSRGARYHFRADDASPSEMCCK